MPMIICDANCSNRTEDMECQCSGVFFQAQDDMGMVICQQFVEAYDED